MKKYPGTVSSDGKGQLVIPIGVRKELLIGEGTAFWVFFVEGEGILLKRIFGDELSYHDSLIIKLKEKSAKIAVEKGNLDRAVEKYRRRKTTSMEEI